MKRYKTWLCGQIGDSAKIEFAQNICNSLDYFDGSVWTVNYNKVILYDTLSDCLVYNTLRDGLVSKNKLGEIIPARWINFHDIGMNLFLQSGHIKEGDWVVWIDSQEKLQQNFLENLNNIITYLETNDLCAAFWGRPYLFKFNSQMRFQGNPHSWPLPLCNDRYLNLQDENQVKYDKNGVFFGNLLYNMKNLEDSHILHALKYIHTYNISNEFQNQYGKFGPQIIQKHEEARLKFRQYCLNELRFKDLSLDTLLWYLINHRKNYDSKLIEHFEFESLYKDFFRLKILQHKLEDILKNRHKWSFKYYLSTGDEKQENNFSYLSVRNMYNRERGFPLE